MLDFLVKVLLSLCPELVRKSTFCEWGEGGYEEDGGELGMKNNNEAVSKLDSLVILLSAFARK